jgi:Xaa-Pro aminopeptidase
MAAILAVVLLAQEALPAIGSEEFARRRSAVRVRMEADAILVLPSSKYDGRFEPSSDFRYLVGFAEPDGLLVLTRQEERLYLPDRDEDRLRWDGPYVWAGSEAARRTGIGQIRRREDASAECEELLAGARILYTDRPEELPEIVRAFVRRSVGRPTRIDRAAALIAGVRVVKSPAEIARIERAAQITCAAHRRVLATARSGLTERDLKAEIEYVFLREGAEEPGFPTIVASGPNACVLHYRAGTRTLAEGEIVVVDIGARFDGYTADVTRTVPAGGRFTERQRAVYEIVLAAQQEAAAFARAGVTLREIHEVAARRVARGLVDLGLLEDPSGYRRYFMHGTCHWIGLDVHDPGPPGIVLAPGMAFTIEPGVYIEEEGIGVRIEDDYVVRDDGWVECISDGAPRTVEEIERLMRGE